MNTEEFERIVRAMAAEGWTRTDITAAVSHVFTKITDEIVRRTYGAQA